jgi:sRNA-binding protein
MTTRADIDNLIALFEQKWPACFSVHKKGRRPLAFGIDREIIAALDGIADPFAIKRALNFYTGNSKYLATVRHGGMCIGLGGEEVEPVTEEQQQHAAEILAERLARDVANATKTVANDTPPPMHPININALKPRLSLKIVRV